MARVLSRARFGLSAAALLLSLTGASYGCADDDGGSGLKSGSVSGRVRDGQSGKALGGARVDFLGDTGETASDKTDDEGRYGIAVQTLTPHGRLTVSKAGYQPRVVSAFFDDTEITVDVELLRE